MSTEISTLIYKAGNAIRDEERLKILMRIRENPTIKDNFREELELLIEAVYEWIYTDELTEEPELFKEDSEEISENSPLFPLVAFYKARVITWGTLERGSIWWFEDRRTEELKKAREMFLIAKKNFPENRVIDMYLGEPFYHDIKYPQVPGAPAWAIYQRESIEKLTDIILWWIDNRQMEDGSYRGGLEDDVEMWRWWMPVMIAFKHPYITEAQEKLSERVMSTKDMKGGFTSDIDDTEHAAELSADAITPMMFLKPQDEEWKKRALNLAELMENLWTGINQRGFLQFKSTYYSVDSVVLSPPRKTCATFYDARTMQPALLYWQRTGDRKLGELFTAWLDGWVDAAMRAERGKPEGLVPSVIHWPDGGIGGLSKDWWLPNNYTDNPIYKWPKHIEMITNSLLLGYYMTDNIKYLEPIREMAEMRLDYLKSKADSTEKIKTGNIKRKWIEANPMISGTATPNLKEGTAEWIGANLGTISNVCVKHKLLTGNHEFDELIEMESKGDPYFSYIFSGDIMNLTKYLFHTAEALRYFMPAYTYEVRWTDRVLRFPHLFTWPAMYKEPISTSPWVNTELLFSTLTGEPDDGLYFPVNAVRWLTRPRDIAALVIDAGPELFEARLFHFGRADREMGAEFYLLKEGNYIFKLISNKTERVLINKNIKVKDNICVVNFKLPSRELCILRIE